MKSLVVLSAVFAVTVAAPQYFYTLLAQPENSPAVVLDPFGRPLDTAEVISARAQHYQAKALDGHVLKKRSIGHDITAAVFEPALEAHAVYAVPSAVYAAPSAVSHQSRVDVRTSPAVFATAPAVVAARTVVEPVSAVVSAPAVVAPVQTLVAAPAAVSHQSRVDVRTSVPKFVATSPVVVAKTFAPAQTVVANPTFVNVPSAYVAPATTVYTGGAAVSHQSRVDVKTSPAVVTEQVVQPAYVATSVVEAAPTVIDAAQAVVDARSVYVSPVNTFYSAGFVKK